MIRLFSRDTAPQSGASVLAGMRVLVVEDDDDARDLVALALGSAGARVVVACDAKQGFRALAEHRPDVIVSDVGMPGEDGITMLRRIRGLPTSKGGATPIVALSAFTAKRDQDRAEHAGFDAYLTKPVDVGALISVVQVLRPRASAE